MTSKLIGITINRKLKANTVLNKLLYNNKCYTDKLNSCDQLNAYFINVGPSLSSQLPDCDNVNTSKYIHRAFSSSFMFRSIHNYVRLDNKLKTCHCILYNIQINARALIGKSAMGYCAGKPRKKSHVFWIII